MPTEAAVTDTSAETLSRAAALLDFVKSSKSRRSAAELASQFDVPLPIVEEILSRNVQKRAVEPKQRSHKGAERWQRTFRSITEHPYLTLVAITLLFFIVPTLVQERFGRWPSAVRVPLFFSALLLPLVVYWHRRRFQIVFFGAAIEGASLGFYASINAPRAKMPEMFHGSAGSFILFVSALIFVGGVHCAVGGLCVLLSDLVQLRRERKRAQQVSRHELVTRLFDLEEQLKTVPPAVQPKSSWPSRMPFLATLAIIGGLGILGGVFAGPFKVARPTPDAIPPAFFLYSVALFVAGIGSTGYVSLAATTWRRALLVMAGFIAGDTLSLLGNNLLAGKKIQVEDAVLGISIIFAFRVALLAAIQLFSFISTELTRARGEGTLTQAEIVGEILQIRQRLATRETEVCVLVVDAANSTKMKEGADPLVAEYSFHQYQVWLSRIVSEFGGRVHINTGDGAIAAFGDVHQALAAAKALQSRLEDFNSGINRLASPFALRIAMHSGKVAADLDKVQFTRVIDVAAHTEKFSPIGGVAFTEPVLHALGMAVTASGTSDGFNIFSLDAESLGNTQSAISP